MDNGGWGANLPPLVFAAARGELAQARILLRQGISPDQSDGSGWSAFEAACAKRHWSVARLLLDAGATLDGQRPIEHIAAGGDLDLLKQMVGAGADHAGAVSAASCWGQLHVLTWLVEVAGADVEDWADGQSAVMRAVEHGAVEAVRELLRLGADPSQSFEGASLADLATGMGYAQLAAELSGQVVEPRRLDWMRWFNAEWHESDDADTQPRIWNAYQQHLIELVPMLPRDLRCLSEAGGRLSLHDARILLLCADHEHRRVIVDIDAMDYFENGRGGDGGQALRLRLVYTDAEVVSPTSREIYRATKQSLEIINCELDFAANNRFEHRLQFEADQPTLVIRFGDATMTVVRYIDDQVSIVPHQEFLLQKSQ